MAVWGGKLLKHVGGSALLLLLSTIFALVLAEYIFRAFEQLQWRRAVTWHQHELYTMLPDSPLEFALRPQVARENRIPKTDAVWSYQINSDGFRGDDFDRGSQRQRVVFVGDSYTFGWGVAQDQVLPRAVERELARPPYSLRIDAYNLGVPGYNTVQEYHLLAQALDRYSPSAVVLGYVMNDAKPQQNVHVRPSIYYGAVRSWLLAFLKQQINQKIYGGEPVFASGVNVHDANYVRELKAKTHNWTAGHNAFVAMAALCKERAVPFIVVIFPSYNKPFTDRYPFRPIHHAVSQWAQHAGVPAIDMLDHVANQDYRLLRVVGDGHPNAQALAQTAAVIAPLLYEVLSDLPLAETAIDASQLADK